MSLRALALLAPALLALAACGGTNSDEDNAEPAAGETVALDNGAPPESLGENAVMGNDITTANDVALSNAM